MNIMIYSIYSWDNSLILMDTQYMNCRNSDARAVRSVWHFGWGFAGGDGRDSHEFWEWWLTQAWWCCIQGGSNLLQMLQVTFHWVLFFSKKKSEAQPQRLVWIEMENNYNSTKWHELHFRLAMFGSLPRFMFMHVFFPFPKVAVIPNVVFQQFHVQKNFRILWKKDDSIVKRWFHVVKIKNLRFCKRNWHREASSPCLKISINCIGSDLFYQ